MSSKKWVLVFLVTVFVLAALLAGLNLAADPFGAFGDRLLHWFSYDETNNPRVAKLSYLEQHLAYPILQKYGMKATIFSIGVSFGKDHYKDTDYAMTPHFGAAEAAEMAGSGLISIQSHTYDMHQWPPYEDGSAAVRENILQLPGESEEAYVEALTADFTRSRAQLEAAAGRPVDVLAYPAGQYSTLAQVTLQNLGVHVTLSTNPGINTVVKGLPQTLTAMLRFGVTEDLSPEALLEMIQ